MSNKFIWSYQAFCEECGSEMVAHKINGHDGPTMCSVQIFLHCQKCVSHLTPLALDGGDSSAFEIEFTPEVLSTLQGESTPATTQVM